LKSARDEHHAVARNRRRDRIHRDALALPDNAAGLEVVAPYLVHPGRDHLSAAVVLDDERRGPRVDLLPIHPPQFVAGQRVERHDERLTLMIPHDDDPIAVENGSAALAELVPHALVAAILRPQQLAVL